MEKNVSFLRIILRCHDGWRPISPVLNFRIFVEFREFRGVKKAPTEKQEPGWAAIVKHDDHVMTWHKHVVSYLP